MQLDAAGHLEVVRSVMAKVQFRRTTVLKLFADHCRKLLSNDNIVIPFSAILSQYTRYNYTLFITISPYTLSS